MENGLIEVYYGDGKGKTTAAIGLGMRAIGNQYKVIMIQFLKNDDTCECKVLKGLEPYFKVFHFEKKRGFTWELTDDEKEELKGECQIALKFASKVMDTGECDVLILDEILNAVQLGIIPEKQLYDLMDNKPEEIELVLTGRQINEEIARRSDYISCIDAIKHPMEKGIAARKGIEF
ncbi:cob(I)yrinic acid a,c-diamide adenosyltransferase [Sporanaerobium hydrogeniformans]|uniref:Cob(I)yrinic acid a,c-diamide adenosyltransferase n=1 Tax=Sporanaerobium hydrogeniformans TaxID=3072179 RepID=A0AC61DCT7_9FIRM|nr:cob(I)yrinic acid a,c-diamide adenosyltransferase [Sporanaerobium hydrogeniformans]PHV70893.1 cob(I)yrinic acid a,c-diamide adenosyltransferase [Sporanaerobium hydrogeniformans]